MSYSKTLRREASLRRERLRGYRGVEALAEIVHLREDCIILGEGFRVDATELKKLSALAAAQGFDRIDTWLEWYLASDGVNLSIEELVQDLEVWLRLNSIEAASEILSTVFIEPRWPWESDGHYTRVRSRPRSEDELYRCVERVFKTKYEAILEDELAEARRCAEHAVRWEGAEARRIGRALEAKMIGETDP